MTIHRRVRLLLIKSAVCAILCTRAIAFGQQAADSTFSWDWLSGGVEISENYNDNILDYSTRDLYKLDLVNHLTTDSIKSLIRDSTLSRYDTTKYAIGRPFDYVTGLKLRLGSSFEWIKNNPTQIRIRYNHYFYSSNSIRNFASWGIEARQSFLRRNYVAIGYSNIPKVYLRNISYRDLTLSPIRWLKYVEANFNKKMYSIEVGRNFTSKFSASLGYDYEVTHYNQELQERDNSTHQLNLDVRLRINPFWRTNFSYVYDVSWAKGRDMSDSLTDISNRSHRFVLGTDVSLKSLIKTPLSISPEFTFEYQKYLSEKEYQFDNVRPHRPTYYGDKSHYGRVDKYYRISVEITYHVVSSLDVFVQYFWEQNSTNISDVSDAGSFQTHQVGSGFQFSF